MKAKRVCPDCGTQHNTVVENSQTGEVESYLQKCMDCIMTKTVFTPVTEQIILTLEKED